METYRNSDGVNDDDLDNANHAISLAQYSQTHPYQYLKQLNNVFNSCNKSAGKDFSVPSKFKLPWKKFKTVSIPKCFEESYNMEKKVTCVLKNSDDNDKSEEVQKEKKFWKEHQQLMKRYQHSTILNHKQKKQKLQERKRNLISAKSNTTSKNRNELFMTKTAGKKLSESIELNESKENHDFRFSLKTQSDHTQTSAICQSKELISSKNKGKGKNESSINLFKDTTNSQSFIKKKTHRSKYYNQDMTVEEQVLMKLKKISMMPHLNRAKTANILSRQTKSYKEREKLEGSYKKTNEQQQIIGQSRVKENEYLQYNLKEDLIERYQNKIKQIDCSISEKNLKKTAEILKEMQQLASVNVEDF